MDLNRFLNINNYKINNIVSRSLRYILYLLLIIFALAFSNLINFDKAGISLCLSFCGILLLIPTLFINCFGIEKDYIRYLVVICTTLVSGVLCSFLSYYASAIVLFPLLIASLYYDRILVLFTTLINTAVLVGASFLSLYVGLIENDPLVDNIESALFFGFIPRELVLIFMSFIAYFIVDRNNEMMADIFIYSQKLKNSQEEIIASFANICESKSKTTGEHVRRVSKYMRILCEASGFDPVYTDMVCNASMMHDIGKLMIPEEIINKPGKLTDEEYAIMKNHVLYGEALLHSAVGEVMELARTMALQHHERWDGKGYLGMKGEEIAYISRLMALCDVFDALSATRCYKEGWSMAQTYNEIALGSGTQFDPDVVELFKNNFDKFVDVFNQNLGTQDMDGDEWVIQDNVKLHE